MVVGGDGCGCCCAGAGCSDEVVVAVDAGAGDDCGSDAVVARVAAMRSEMGDSLELC